MRGKRGREGRPVPLWQFLLAGLAIGLMATVVATILFVLPLVFAAALLSADKAGTMQRRAGRWAAGVACAIAGMGAGTSPCWIHNYFIAKDPVFLSAHGGLNFWIGNNPFSTGYPMVPPGLKASDRGMLVDSFAWPPRWLHRPMKRGEISRFWSDRARASSIHEHPMAWLKLMVTKVGKFWSGYEYDDLDILARFRASGVTFGFLTFGMVAMCGVPAAFFAVRESQRALWVVAAILLQMAALLPVFVTERYRLAAVPGLILLSAFGLWWLWNRVQERRWKAIACYLALAAPVIWWVNVPQSETGVLALEQYNKGIQALAANDFDRAGELLEKAHQGLPDNADVNAALGSLALNRGDEDTAKKFLHIALEHDPKNFVAWQNLGVVALLEQKPDIGAKCFEQAIMAEPEDANSYMLLAKALGLLRQYPDAIKAVSEAMRLEPGRPDAAPLKAELLRAQGGN